MGKFGKTTIPKPLPMIFVSSALRQGRVGMIFSIMPMTNILSTPVNCYWPRQALICKPVNTEATGILPRFWRIICVKARSFQKSRFKLDFILTDACGNLGKIPAFGRPYRRFEKRHSRKQPRHPSCRHWQRHIRSTENWPSMSFANWCITSMPSISWTNGKTNVWARTSSQGRYECVWCP